jgi:hypothetical protein
MIAQSDQSFASDNYLERVIVEAQTKGQFYMICGAEGTQALFTRLSMCYLKIS